MQLCFYVCWSKRCKYAVRAFAATYENLFPSLSSSSSRLLITHDESRADSLSERMHRAEIGIKVHFLVFINIKWSALIIPPPSAHLHFPSSWLLREIFSAHASHVKYKKQQKPFIFTIAGAGDNLRSICWNQRPPMSHTRDATTSGCWA